jgi:hypothetical protein
VKTLYWAAGLLIYLILIVLITKTLGQYGINTDRRRMDRRLKTEDQRKSQRNAPPGGRRVKERRSAYGGIPA